MNDLRQKLTRRELLGLMGAAGTAVVIGCSDDGGSKPAATATEASAAASPTTGAAATSTAPPSTVSCVVSPAMTEGPYFVEEELNRSDITVDPGDGTVSEGVPLTLAISVSQVGADTSCTPIAGAHVDVWHCDAGGLYSDVAQNNTVGQKFLRGYQLTDENGRVQFETIYPGWYMGRTVHIHVKVRTEPEAEQGYEFISQLFFDESISDQVYANPPYNTRGQQDTANASDGIYQGGGSQMQLSLTPEGNGYLGSIDIGIQPA